MAGWDRPLGTIPGAGSAMVSGDDIAFGGGRGSAGGVVKLVTVNVLFDPESGATKWFLISSHPASHGALKQFLLEARPSMQDEAAFSPHPTRSELLMVEPISLHQVMAEVTVAAARLGMQTRIETSESAGSVLAICAEDLP